MPPRAKEKKSDLIRYHDHIYYNISIQPDSVTPKIIPANFSENRGDPILDNPENFHMTVLSASISGTNIPIFVYPTVINTSNNSLLADNQFYSVTLSYGTPTTILINTVAGSPTIISAGLFTNTLNGITITGTGIQAGTTALFIDVNTMTLNKNATITGSTSAIFRDFQEYTTWIPQSQLVQSGSQQLYTDEQYFYLFSYQHFINIINNSFAAAFTRLKAAFPAAPGTQAPYLIYNKDDQIISLITQDAFANKRVIVVNTSATNQLVAPALFTADLVGATVSGSGIPLGTTVTSFSNPSLILLSNNTTATQDDIPVQFLLTSVINIYINYKLASLFESFDLNYYSLTAPQGKENQFLIEDRPDNCYSSCPQNIQVTTTNLSTVLLSLGQFNISMDGNTISAAGIPINTTVTFVNANTMSLSHAATASDTVNAILTNNNLIITSQEFPTLYLWNDAKSIVITSGTVPTYEEYIPSGANSGSNDNFRKIVLQFDIPVRFGTETRESIQYLPTAEYRRIDLKGKTELSTFDLTVYWQGIDLTLHPVYLLPYGAGVDMKFVFQRRQKPILEGF